VPPSLARAGEFNGRLREHGRAVGAFGRQRLKPCNHNSTFALTAGDRQVYGGTSNLCLGERLGLWSCAERCLSGKRVLWSALGCLWPAPARMARRGRSRRGENGRDNATIDHGRRKKRRVGASVQPNPLPILDPPGGPWGAPCGCGSWYPIPPLRATPQRSSPITAGFRFLRAAPVRSGR
jgi:hypothetical protein